MFYKRFKGENPVHRTDTKGRKQQIRGKKAASECLLGIDGNSHKSSYNRPVEIIRNWFDVIRANCTLTCQHLV